MKRERENPCGVCGHYHKYEAGEVCGVCGHRMPLPASEGSQQPTSHISAFPSEILPDFLYLGSYDNASRSELLKTLGISRILNTVPACQNLYKNSFTYHCLDDSSNFDDAIEYLEQCAKEKTRVLVHCMSGRSRSPAIVIAYLMKSKGWQLAQSYQWVKERRPSVELSQTVSEQLRDYEKSIFDQMTQFRQAFSFGFPKIADPAPFPSFTSDSSASIFSRPMDMGQFQFGAGHPQNLSSNQTPHSHGKDL